ncbi:MAG: hypothetical protein VKK42_16545 [Lyngbya sp.]|nr:hypothetical protein [Lyngbya sp.]
MTKISNRDAPIFSPKAQAENWHLDKIENLCSKEGEMGIKLNQQS